VLDEDMCSYTLIDPGTRYLLLMSHVRDDEYSAAVCTSAPLSDPKASAFASALEVIAPSATAQPEQLRPAAPAPSADGDNSWIVPTAIGAGVVAFAAALLARHTSALVPAQCALAD
jgi:hypothetical protein